MHLLEKALEIIGKITFWNTFFFFSQCNNSILNVINENIPGSH